MYKSLASGTMVGQTIRLDTRLARTVNVWIKYLQIEVRTHSCDDAEAFLFAIPVKPRTLVNCYGSFVSIYLW